MCSLLRHTNSCLEWEINTYKLKLGSSSSTGLCLLVSTSWWRNKEWARQQHTGNVYYDRLCADRLLTGCSRSPVGISVSLPTVKAGGPLSFHSCRRKHQKIDIIRTSLQTCLVNFNFYFNFWKLLDFASSQTSFNERMYVTKGKDAGIRNSITMQICLRNYKKKL